MANQLAIHAPRGELVRGETVVVPIVLTLEKRLKVRGIHARFWGAEETKATYTTTSTDGKGHTTTHTHTAVEHVHIVDQQKVLAGHERLGCFRGLGDALATLVGGGRHVVLEPREHSFEVDVMVPDGAPATHAGTNSRIFYELSVRCDVPLAFDLKAKHSFDVAPLPAADPPSQSVRVRYPGDGGGGFWDKLLAPDVRVELALAGDVFRQGETIEGIVMIENDKPLTINALWASLVATEQTQAQGHHESAHHAGQRVQICDANPIQGRLSQTFSLPVELAGPPTLRGKLFSIDWFVQVQLDVPWAKDPKIRTPIRLLRT
ncbi:MAG: sporulation protein [Pirellulales bacterium]